MVAARRTRRPTDPMIPPSVAAMRLSRRSFVRSAAMGGALLGVPGLLSACGGDDGGSGSDSLTLGMNEAGDIPPAQRFRAMCAAFTEKSGIEVERNEVEHNTFQEH